ncbi:MAG: hypothetical protein B6U76_04880 [Desulfurococcales archaeon ex4484_217_2]|nr:MAG: hypothetical protein B6U76_04880 [Desulfurococcales archaeon ex4484_217_2]
MHNGKIKDKCKVLIDVVAEVLDKRSLQKLYDIIKGMEQREILESRKELRNKISSMLVSLGRKEAPQIVFIRGEWGEGKSTSFYLYVQPKAKELGFETVRETMLNIIPLLEKIGPKMTFESYPELLLGLMLFNRSIYASNYEKIGVIRAFDVILDVLKRKKPSKLLLFLDEFEEILGDRGEERIKLHSAIEPLSIRSIISYALRDLRRDPGIQLLRKLQRSMANEKFMYHLVIATTPYAYSEYMQTFSEVIRGKIERTFEDIIDLRGLSRIEAYNYIKELVEKLYCKVPIHSVFKDSRMLQTLHVISQGNIAALIALLNRLINFAVARDLEVIDDDAFIEALKDYKVFTYMGSAPAISEYVVNSVMKALDPISQKVFSALLAKYIVSLVELAKEYGASRFYVERNINQVLRERYFLENAIVNMLMYKVGDVRNSRFILNMLKAKIKQYNENLDDIDIERALENIVLITNHDVFLCLPATESDEKNSEILSKILSMETPIIITKDLYKDLRDTIEDKIKDYIEGYMIVPELQMLIYPIPVPLALRFIEDITAAFSLWREAYDKISSLRIYEKEIIGHFLRSINRAFRLRRDFRIAGRIMDSNLVAEVKYKDYEFSLIITCVLQPLLPDKEKALKDLAKRCHVLALFVLAQLYPDIKHRSIAREENVLILKLPTNVLAQVIVYSLAFNRGKRINLKAANDFLTRVMQETGFYDELFMKIKDLERKGFIVKDPIGLKKPIRSLEDFLNYYALVLLGSFNNIVDIDKSWEIYSLLNTFRLYGKERREEKPPILRVDIESYDKFRSELYSSIDIYVKNSLILRENGTCKVALHPVEKRIIDIIRDVYKGEVSEQRLKEHFIIMEKVFTNVLTRLYVNMLVRRGMLVRKAGIYHIVDKEDLIREFYEEIEKLRKKVKELKELCYGLMEKHGISEVNYDVIHIGMVKKHEELLLCIEDIEKLIDTMDKNALHFSTSQIALLKDFMSYVSRKHIDSLMKNSLVKIDETLEKITDYYNRCTESLKELAKTLSILYNGLIDYNTLLNYMVNNMEEHLRAHEIFNSGLDLLTWRKDKIREVLKEERKQYIKKHIRPYFFFSKTPEEASYFNIILYKLSAKEKDIKDHYDRLRQKLIDVKRVIGEIKEIEKAIKEHVEAISKKIKDKRYIKDVKRLINESYDLKRESLKLLKGITSIDDLCYRILSYLKNALERLRQNIDEKVKNIEKAIGRYNEIYEAIKDIVYKDAQELSEEIEYLQSIYEEIKRISLKNIIPIDKQMLELSRNINHWLKVKKNIDAHWKDLELGKIGLFSLLNDQVYEELKHSVRNYNQSSENVHKLIEEIRRSILSATKNILDLADRVFTITERIAGETFDLRLLDNARRLQESRAKTRELINQGIIDRGLLGNVKSMLESINSIREFLKSIVARELASLGIKDDHIGYLIEMIKPGAFIKIEDLRDKLDIPIETAALILAKLLKMKLIRTIEAKV